jgi:thioredoxin reductase (NADPH)
MVELVGEMWDTRSHAFRDLLERNGIPHTFYDAESKEGQALLHQVQRPQGPFPVMRIFNGIVLTNPSIQEAAEALGAPSGRPSGVYDMTIIGGGPAGLSAAVYGASEGLRTLVIEREAMGGQAGTSSRIRNYLGFPRGITGGELARRAWEQAALFGAEYYLVREAVSLHADGPHRLLTLADGSEIASRTVVLAMGVRYRRLGIPSLEELVGAGVFYGAAMSEAPAMAGEEVFVVGAGNSAGQAAVHLAKYASCVTMLVRGESLAASMSDYLIKEIATNDRIKLRLHTQVADGWGQNRLERLVLRDNRTSETEEVGAAGLFVLIGGHPHTDWLADLIQRDEQGYILTGRELISSEELASSFAGRRPYLLETCIPGVFAVGDVRHRSVKRVASAVGEGSIAVQLVHEYLAQLEQAG